MDIEYEDVGLEDGTASETEKASILRARSSAQLMRPGAGIAAALGVIGTAAVYGVFFRQVGDEDRWSKFLTATIPAVAVGVVSLIAVGLLLASSALVDLYAERIDTATDKPGDE